MEHDSVIKAHEKMQKTIAVYKNELLHIRAGRANPRLLDNIRVDYYGTLTPINGVSNLSSPEPRMLVISPWDSSMITMIEKAILASELGITPGNDGKVIRLLFPELTQERRLDLVKSMKKKAEEARVAVRSVRREANEVLEKSQKAGEITEDDLGQLQKKVQKMTDDSITEIGKLTDDKEKEVMEV